MRNPKKLLLWLPAVLWYGLIWCLSAQPADLSDGVSDGVIGGTLTAGGAGYQAAETGVRLSVEEMLSFFFRKGAHIFLYFTLALLIWLALVHLMKSRPRRAARTFLACVLLAALDEYHQTFVPGRTGLPRDVLVDLIGTIIALLLFALPALSRKLRKTAHPERLWVLGAICGGALLVYVGLLDHISFPFLLRVTNSHFFMDMEENARLALLADSVPIMRQALYLAVCAFSGFGCVLLAVLSENRRAVSAAFAAALILAALSGLVWDLALLPGLLLVLLAGCAALCLWALFPLLRR